MILCVLCTNPEHPVHPWLRRWKDEREKEGHEVSLCCDRSQLKGGDVLFLVSCGQIIRDAERRLFKAVLVLHASDLPQGRGWSPHVWSILHGADVITVSLIEARDPVDSGDVWLRTRFKLGGHELLPEINRLLFDAELELMTRAIDRLQEITPVAQVGDPGLYLRKRTAEDSRLDPNKTIAEQFDLLRVVDNDRYPAWLTHRGSRYVLRIDKVDHE
jgi:methionyl-tRNA formyltransferase